MPRQAQDEMALIAGGSVWRRFVALFLTTFVGGVAGVYSFILLVDPYELLPFSLPIERVIVSGNQRYVYPQIIRSRRHDGLIVGTSTSRLIDPEMLNAAFGVRFANLAMNAATAWEQLTLFQYFFRHAGPPKAFILGLEGWCKTDADRDRITPHGFPHWLYDDSRWNDFTNLFNSEAAILASRLVRHQFRPVREVLRSDGFAVFTPPEHTYDLERARRNIWLSRTPAAPPDLPPPALSDNERRTLNFPALTWLDEMMAQLPPATLKVLVHMPVHVAARAWPGTPQAAIESECKARIAAIARARGAKVIDWSITSTITTDDASYWDGLHYRLPIARRIAEGLIAGVLHGVEPADGSYRQVVR